MPATLGASLALHGTFGFLDAFGIFWAYYASALLASLCVDRRLWAVVSCVKT
jgi:hypothetical protein